jgi:hypothetical protein
MADAMTYGEAGFQYPEKLLVVVVRFQAGKISSALRPDLVPIFVL